MREVWQPKVVHDAIDAGHVLLALRRQRQRAAVCVDKLHRYVGDSLKVAPEVPFLPAVPASTESSRNFRDAQQQ